MDWNTQRQFRLMQDVLHELQRRVKELEDKANKPEVPVLQKVRETLRLRKDG